jgi:ABC-type glycerol-3-phosphate transport system substrate-binding protein
MTMNRKIARLGAAAVAAAGLGTAAIVPLAGSASAATTSTSAAATTYKEVELPFTGHGPSQDLQECQNLAQLYQGAFPNDVAYCHLHYTPSNPLYGNDDLYTAWLFLFIPS